MILKQIEVEVLNLPENERADLASKLLHSLDSPSEDWLLEASHRTKDLDKGLVQPNSAEDVRIKAQALLR